ncbi:RagB/SusD family nutrient uptake outer membrane protein [Polaribacter sp. Z022]|uniref:RagB/SusD family nutrient uptake outer membrane protein n=1 Tax=Polaribacter sp. Z022 TaxID=2927125 RepID=UPI0020228802|nr:RagB/SusD family nutrient uptake outer membrane protein [Polaribacter sp. Z022]MCL7752682.1 RagB/SusD family nutrient uptake outer membrane protein [Polaribacter sp. Z022]
MKNLYSILLGTLMIFSACSTDLDQVPPNLGDASSITDFTPVLFAAYNYQNQSVEGMAIFGDFRSDNALFDEEFTDFDSFTAPSPLAATASTTFLEPFYVALYNSILSANNVILNSSDATLVAEAKFIRGLSYFKLVQVFGDVTVNLINPTVEEIAAADIERKSKTVVYNNVIIPDLQDAIDGLPVQSAAEANGRATKYAAQGLLGKVYATLGNYSDAEIELEAVVNGANAASTIAGMSFADVFSSDLNSAILFSTQMTGSITYSGTKFTDWYAGQNTKADEGGPISPDLVSAFSNSVGDVRMSLTVDNNGGDPISVKYNTLGATEQDWIELRLADVVLLYAEALNENSKTNDAITQLNIIRNRAGLGNTIASTQTEVRKAILDERRLELACEGHRWFDLVRAEAAQPGIMNAEMGATISSDYYIFPIPNGEVTSFDKITQNQGY